MKKTLALFAFLVLFAALVSGCVKNAEEEPEQTPLPKATQEVDVDLTKLSSVMVYSEVYNMMMEPEKYMGKTVKMRGPYYASFYEPTQQYYHFIIIEDATACCQQGLEFVLNGDYEYPKDYPQDSEEIEVTGVFSSYEELGQTYYCIVADAMSVR